MLDPTFFYDDDDLGGAKSAAAPKTSATSEDIDKAFQKGVEIGKQIGAQAERDRIKMLMSTDAAKRDPVSAARLALNPDTPAAPVKSSLGGAWSVDELVERINAENRRAGIGAGRP